MTVKNKEMDKYDQLEESLHDNESKEDQMDKMWDEYRNSVPQKKE
jgi:hypothetical protein